jgi:hypothetical protein
MSCPQCVSSNQADFTAEINIHFSGSSNLDRPGLFVFPKLMVCLDCGFAGFAIAEREVRPLREGRVTAAAA